MTRRATIKELRTTDPIVAFVSPMGNAHVRHRAHVHVPDGGGRARRERDAPARRGARAVGDTGQVRPYARAALASGRSRRDAPEQREARVPDARAAPATVDSNALRD